MSKWSQRYLFTGTFTVLLVLSAFKYYNNYKITAPEAASTVLTEVANENRVFQVSDTQAGDIEILYESLKLYNLPHIEISKIITSNKDYILEKVIFIKDLRSEKWIIVPRRTGETDDSYIERNSNGNYLLQEISLESSEKDTNNNSYKVTTKVCYLEFDEGDVKKRYNGSVIFMLKKLSFNQWKVEEVQVTPVLVENNV